MLKCRIIESWPSSSPWGGTEVRWQVYNEDNESIREGIASSISWATQDCKKGGEEGEEIECDF